MVLLNWENQPRELTFSLNNPSRVRELWTDEDLGRRAGSMSMMVPAHGGRVLICRSV